MSVGRLLAVGLALGSFALGLDGRAADRPRRDPGTAPKPGSAPPGKVPAALRSWHPEGLAAFTWPQGGDPAKEPRGVQKLECYSCHEVRGERFPRRAITGRAGPELSTMGRASSAGVLRRVDHQPERRPSSRAAATPRPDGFFENAVVRRIPDGPGDDRPRRLPAAKLRPPTASIRGPRRARRPSGAHDPGGGDPPAGASSTWHRPDSPRIVRNGGRGRILPCQGWSPGAPRVHLDARSRELPGPPWRACPAATVKGTSCATTIPRAVAKSPTMTPVARWRPPR